MHHKKRPFIRLTAFCTFIFIFFSCFASEEVRIQQVYDGDSFLLEDGRSVRLIGVDAPESYESKKLSFDSERMKKDIESILNEGKISKEFVKNLIEGKKVKIEYDIMNATVDHKDKYGRELVYIKFLMKKPPPELLQFIDAKGIKAKWRKKEVNLNAILIQCGRAFAYTKYHFKYKDNFKKFEKIAKKAKIGIWEKY